MITSLIRILTARSLRPFIFSSAHNNEIDFNVESPGLYFHIPFCRKLCPFCPYYKVKYDKNLLEDFCRALIKEVELAAELSRNSRDKTGKKNIESIYFGGGSPALAVDYLPEILSRVKSLFSLEGDMGIELNPSDVNEVLLEKLKDCGFNMVSIGVQSFQDKCLAALERERIDSVKKLGLVKKFKFDVVDVDLIFGIPGQGEKDLVRDFITAAENGATQVSTYPFIEFSYTGLKDRPPDSRQKKRMLAGLMDISRKAGFKRSSIWTFSKGDSLKYSSVTRDSFIGFGPSAASLLGDIFKINTFSVTEYIKYLNDSDNSVSAKHTDDNGKNLRSAARSKLPTALSMKFNPRVRALYWLFWSAYKLDIDSEKFYRLSGKKPDEMFKIEFYLARKFGYIEKYSGGYKLTERGAYLFHLIEQTYTRQYIDKTWRMSLENPWPERIALH